MQVLGLSLPSGLSWGRQQPWVRQAGLEGTAVSPEVPHWAHPQPSTQPTQLSALHITSLSFGHGELSGLAELGRNKSSLAPAGLGTKCLDLCCELMAAGAGPAAPRGSSKQHRGRVAAHRACPQKPCEQCTTSYRKQSFISFPWTSVATPGRREGISHALADVLTYVRLNFFFFLYFKKKNWISP